MNALMYFGQQNIQAGVINDGQFTTTGTIASETDMNNITYQVNTDPLATGGTWVANNYSSGQNSAFNQFGQHMDTVLGPTIIGYNYPINVYPAGNYGYSVTPAGDAGRVGETTVNYPAGLGTSVSANFKDSGNAASPSTTVTNGSGDSLT